MDKTGAFPFNQIALVLSQLLIASGSSAAVITVDTLTDNPVDGCTLREAVLSANSDSAHGGCVQGVVDDEIVFAPGLTGSTVTLGNGELLVGGVNGNLTIGGTAQKPVTIRGSGANGVIEVSLSNLTLNHATVSGGSAGTRGGGISVQGVALELNYSTISDNSAVSRGGGIYGLDATIQLFDSTVSGNRAINGGGMYLNNGFVSLNSSNLSSNTASNAGGGVHFLSDGLSGNSLNVSSSTISGNSSGANGGGVSLSNIQIATITGSSLKNNTGDEGGGVMVDNSSLSLSNSTLSSNSAQLRGSAILVYGSSTASIENTTVWGNRAGRYAAIYAMPNGIPYPLLNLQNATIAGNSSSAKSSGLQVWTTTVNMRNTVIADRVGGEDDCRAGGLSTFNALENSNLVEDDYNCAVFAFEGQDPSLSTLQDNGGVTMTVAPYKGSPLIDAGSNSYCPSPDQRGEPRSDGKCDIGAYEGYILDDACFVVPDGKGKSVVFCM